MQRELKCLSSLPLFVAGQTTAAGSSEAQDLQLKVIISQLKLTKDDKEKLENDLFASQQEKERLAEQVKHLEKERQAAQTDSRGERVKTVAVAGDAQQQEREEPAPLAHIQPHLRNEHRCTQTASVAQRATSQAVVLPTSQMSPGQPITYQFGVHQWPGVATVQPTVSRSPSVSSSTGASAASSQQVLSTSQPGSQQPGGSQQHLSAALLLEEGKQRGMEEKLMSEESAKTTGEKLGAEKATDMTNTSSSQLEEDTVVAQDSKENVELEQGSLEIASKGAEEAVHKEGKGSFQKSRSQKRKTSERREDLLISQQKQQDMLLTTIGCGLSQLIEDEETPATMLGSLKALKHFTTFSTEDKVLVPCAPQKKRKIPEVEKQDQEYFEYNEMKMEPMEHETSAQDPEQQNYD